MQKLFLVMFSAAVIAGAIFCSSFFFEGNNSEMTPTGKLLPIPAAKSVPKKIEPPPTYEKLFEGMYESVQKILNDGSAYSVYIAYPEKNPRPFIYNSRQVRSASMIKIFIMATIMQEVKDGNISLQQKLAMSDYDKVGGAGVISAYAAGTEFEISTLINYMIVESDNTATNMLIDFIGMQKINEYIQKNGYIDTKLQSPMMQGTLKTPVVGANLTSVRDLGNFFLKLRNYECVGDIYDATMISYLKGQRDRDCFPAALPGKIIAHKTGAIDGIYDDGGIIFGGTRGDVILVITSEGFIGESIVIESMKKFAQFVVYKN